MIIKQIIGRQILDSRGNPTVEADVVLETGALGRAAVPSGASTGTHEALELRDGGRDYGGKGVQKAVENINTIISKSLVGVPCQQGRIDEALKNLDGTAEKFKLGANAVLSVSLAAAHAAAEDMGWPLFRYFGQLAGNSNFIMPRPMMNIINGGKHATSSTEIQEFMIVPNLENGYVKNLQAGVEIYHRLGEILTMYGYETLLGDEGGYAPHVRGGNVEVLDLIMQAIKVAGYEPGKQVELALDVAASEFYKEGKYRLRGGKLLSSEQLIDSYSGVVDKYPISSIEDGLDQDDWAGWTLMTSRLGGKVQLVGDDLLVTNTKLLKRAITQKAATAILIKPNQIGTLTETIEAVKMAQPAGWRAIISHRSGETEDTTIAHLAVGLGTGFIKTGAPARGERTAKYNELLRIEELLSADKRRDA